MPSSSTSTVSTPKVTSHGLIKHEHTHHSQVHLSTWLAINQTRSHDSSLLPAGVLSCSCRDWVLKLDLNLHA
jgi:hypothetical protein